MLRHKRKALSIPEPGEGAYSVPCMVRWPGAIKPRTVSNELVSHHDR